MNKKASLFVKLRFEDEHFNASALINFDQPRKEITFILNQTLSIEDIYSEDRELKWEMYDKCELQFRVKSNIIRVS